MVWEKLTGTFEFVLHGKRVKLQGKVWYLRVQACACPYEGRWMTSRAFEMMVWMVAEKSEMSVHWLLMQ